MKITENTWKAIAVFLFVILLGIGLYFSYNYIAQKNYNQGIIYGSNQAVLGMINVIDTQKVIPVMTNTTNYRWVRLEEICFPPENEWGARKND